MSKNIKNYPTVLVAGGAGYIGAHMVKMLRHSGYTPVVLDNLSNGHPDAVHGSELIVGDIGDASLLDRLFSTHKPLAIMHFAGFIDVGESVREPEKYYRNNVFATQVLLERMRAHNISKFIFSSTAAIFGHPQYVPIDESHPKCPINPYGRSKLMVETMLEDYDAAYGLQSVCLRYFNAAGADPDGELGESHNPETHLIPIVLQVASGRREKMTINGGDYPTPDGTCIRDYIHVVDLCSAHLAALRYLQAGGTSAAYNLGNGQGFSVREILEVVQRVTGRPLSCDTGPRRPGDPPSLVADASKAKKDLAWSPQYTNLEKIISHAWRWEQSLARKFAS